MTRPLRIALLLATPGSTWGGMEKHTLELARGLSESGHEVHVLADADYREPFMDVSHFHPAPVQYSRRHPWLGLRLRRLLRRIQPDICHAQGNKAAQLLSNVKRRRGTTESMYVGTLHGTKSSHRAFARLDGVIAVSDDIAESLEHPNKTVIFNGISTLPLSATTAFEPPTERPLVVAAGRLEPVKGFDRLLRAWSQEVGHGQLVILGEGSARGKLEKQVKQLGLEDRATLPGYETNVRAWLKQADLCIISSDREGFPYILVEALLSECPIISTPVSGVSTWLPEGCIAASLSTDDLAACLSSALADLPALRETLAPTFARAAESLTCDAMVRRTVAFYEHLAAATPDSDEAR
ncbi:glycosyltransferase [Marinobacter nanhaiticus D15-8W]|uniref:Glycosyltransferase n=1 Tax=Marinobacter nanhaiticus D15-8W TaxID=626887 RepID=N6WM57_9GAMM|nr:glycosyltransferase [Marinobacter nanhaiticus]ENO12576.1 glycosyltransferase [Marinobacter nanhaiticus D15-8W]BES69913.1 glycosyltransferase [Marinobacter nanhaiticus D15-8W]